MARHKNINWNFEEKVDTAEAALATLMDIRDELQMLNRLLGCPNFTRIPGVLDAIRKQTNRIQPRKRKKTKL